MPQLASYFFMFLAFRFREVEKIRGVLLSLFLSLLTHLLPHPK